MYSRMKRPVAGFTIVELLTIMSIIVILISLLLPALNRVRRYSQNVRQNAQFHSIDVGMEMFRAENDGYPPSGRLGADNSEYPGAMKLAEAMVGQDLLGYHPASDYRLSNITQQDLYQQDNPQQENIRRRRGPYIELENANATKMGHLFANPGNNWDDAYVLCDVFSTVTIQPNNDDISGRTGMPILYYRARRSGSTHPFIGRNGQEIGSINDDTNIYNHRDNYEIVRLGQPDEGIAHFMTPDSPEDGAGIFNFYNLIRNRSIAAENAQQARPQRRDTYILHSAGHDGIYGTENDIFNFRR